MLPLIQIILVLYIVAPLLIFFTSKAKIHPEIVAINPEQIPHEWSTYLYSHEQSLASLGFSEATYLQLPSAMPGATATLVMMVNRHTGDKVMITVLFVVNESVTTKTLYLEFSTRTEDGRCFDTLNSKQLSSFRRAPSDTKTYVPSVTSPLELYQIHRMVLQENDVQTAKKVVYPVGGAAEYLSKVWTQGFDEQVAFGQYRRDEKAGIFRLTLPGAYRNTWMLMAPFNYVRIALRGLNERKVLARARATDHEPLSAYFLPPMQTLDQTQSQISSPASFDL